MIFDVKQRKETLSQDLLTREVPTIPIAAFGQVVVESH